MQIVIDIPEELYQMCRSCLGDADCIESAIANGIPLPKGHGDLIDRDELERYAGWYNLATYDRSIRAVLTKDIDWVKPVIKRTKEGDEE